jgi:hypothetical protein
MSFVISLSPMVIDDIWLVIYDMDDRWDDMFSVCSHMTDGSRFVLYHYFNDGDF